MDNYNPKIKLSMRATIVFIGMLLTPTVLLAQTKAYTLTAKLQPFFIHPETGRDVTEGMPLQAIHGLKRGADGALYGFMATQD
jgi:hypothetical protein